jgi:hypothetical protein
VSTQHTHHLFHYSQPCRSHLDVKLGHRRVYIRRIAFPSNTVANCNNQKLQRAIAEYRGQSAERPLPLALTRTASIEALYRSDESAAETKGKQRQQPATNTTATSTGTGAVSGTISGTGTGTGTKRKYRRHPKVSQDVIPANAINIVPHAPDSSDHRQADENAPERPPSAYVIFSNRRYPCPSSLHLLNVRRCARASQGARS